MNANDIYFKTAAGAEEVRSRTRRLSPRLRTMLIMVDGVRTVAQLQAAAAALGAPQDFLDTLDVEGLVALQIALDDADAVAAESVPAPAPEREPPAQGGRGGGEIERFTAARRLMNDTAVDAMGFRAFLFTLKLERCFTRQDLRALLPEFTQHLTKSRGELFARRVTDHVRTLLD